MKRLPVKVLEEIYFKGIIPCVTYCIAVWGTCPTASFNRLEVLHAKTAKIIHKLSSETHDLEALRISNWKPLSYIYKRRIAAIMYQVRNKTLPRQLVELFPLQDNSTNHHNLRHKKKKRSSIQRAIDLEPYPMRRKKCTDLIDLQNENETSIKRHRECTV